MQHFYLIVIIAASIFFLYIAVPFILKKFLRMRFLQKTKKSCNIFLTFDDGPNPEST
jgi:hypothetical protein